MFKDCNGGFPKVSFFYPTYFENLKLQPQMLWTRFPVHRDCSIGTDF